MILQFVASMFRKFLGREDGCVDASANVQNTQPCKSEKVSTDRNCETDAVPGKLMHHTCME